MSSLEKLQPSSITIDNLSVTYGSYKALESVTGTFSPGTLTAIIGSNGSGKSTLLKAIMGLLKTKRGAVDPGYRKLRPQVAYLPQQSEIDRSFPLRVEDFICTGFWNEVGSFWSISQKQHEEVHEVLTMLGLKGFEERTLDALSGGQFQRVLFARLIIQDRPIIFLDEPFAGIDQETVRDLVKVILNWHDQGKTVAVVLHDIDLVKRYFPDTLLLGNKVLCWDKTDKVFENKEVGVFSGFLHNYDANKKNVS